MIGDIAVDPVTGRIVTTHPRDGTASILDPHDPGSAACIGLTGDPVAVAAAGGRAFVATSSPGYDAVSVFDTDDATPLSVHPLAFTITGISTSPDGATLFAASTGQLYIADHDGAVTALPIGALELQAAV